VFSAILADVDIQSFTIYFVSFFWVLAGGPPTVTSWHPSAKLCPLGSNL